MQVIKKVLPEEMSKGERKQNKKGNNLSKVIISDEIQPQLYSS
jgi:hypothetical protein